jgi:hypothetical protein
VVSERTRDPWERLPGETPRAYEAFRKYRDLGPLRSLSQLTDVSRSSAHGWSRSHRWHERAQAWDAETHRVEDQRRLEQIRTMDREHQRVARGLIAAAVRSLQDVRDLTPHQAARFVDLGTRLERATLLGEHFGPLVPAVEEEQELSPLERIARELAGTA